MARPEPVLKRVQLEPHGGTDGSSPPRFDFSVNSNLFGPPPELLGMLAGLELSSYPDPTERAARLAAASFHGVSAERIVLGSAAELIYRLAGCYLDASRSVLIAAPTFGEYARASLLHGTRVHTVNVYDKDSEPEAETLVEAILSQKPTLVFLCQPNNPTGHVWSEAALAEIAAHCERVGALLVLDAAYLELSDAPRALPETAVQLVPLTKTFALAGLRVGYAVAPPDVADTLRHAAPPWPASTPAQAAVSWCRSDAGRTFAERTVPELLGLRRDLQASLKTRGCEVWESHTSFFLLKAPFPELAAEARRAGFRLRDTASLGLPGHVRIAAQSQEANNTLLTWLTRNGGVR